MKLDDIPFIVKNVEDHMPRHTENTASIPHTQFPKFPKDIMEHSSNVDNKFLNNHLAEIEEMYYTFPCMHSRRFEMFQLKYFTKFCITNHDGFFNSQDVRDWIDTHPYPLIQGSSPQTNLPVNLDTLHGAGGSSPGCEVNNGAQAVTHTDTNRLDALKMGTGSCICDTYDQIAIDIRTTGGGTYTIAAYDQVSCMPKNLYGNTSTLTPAIEFAFQSVAEFTLCVAPLWGAYMAASTTFRVWRGTCPLTRCFEASETYPTFCDPLCDCLSNDCLPARMKIAHT